jgi:hypothetical protein
VKTYRQDAHIVSLVVWAVVCIVAAFILFAHSAHLVGRPLFWAEVSAGAALLVFGPLGFMAYLIRSRLVWVKVDPAQGIVVSGKYVIPWEDIREIRRTRPRLRKKAGPAEMGKFPNIGDVGGCEGCTPLDAEGILVALALILVILALIVFVWLIFVVVVPLLLIPLLEVYAPFGDRIRIRGRKRDLFLRDLRDADGFLREIGTRARVSVR